MRHTYVCQRESYANSSQFPINFFLVDCLDEANKIIEEQRNKTITPGQFQQHTYQSMFCSTIMRISRLRKITYMKLGDYCLRGHRKIN